MNTGRINRTKMRGGHPADAGGLARLPFVGKLDMSEMAVSQTTGTYSIRAVFDNPDGLVLPGMYVRATVTVGTEEGYLIPQRAATRSANGELSAKFVTAENKVETRVFDEAQVFRKQLARSQRHQ